MILFVVITRATPETSIRLWRVIQFVRIATPHFTKGGQTPVRLAMTKKILSLRGFVKTEVIHKKEILLFWIASLHAVCLTLCALATATLAMTDIKNKVAHAVRREAMIIIVITRAMPEVIQNVCCAFLITMWLQPIVLTIQIEAHKGLKPLVIRNWIASLHAVCHMAMTITKIFNSISFRDYSLLFIKN